MVLPPCSISLALTLVKKALEIDLKEIPLWLKKFWSSIDKIVSIKIEGTWDQFNKILSSIWDGYIPPIAIGSSLIKSTPIVDEYKLLKQSVSFKFQNLDYRTAIELMAKAGEINILIGDEVAGSVTAQLIDIPWDKAFNALLDLKN